MIVGLHDAEREHLRNKTYPNYALMKISAYHKQMGDAVNWWNPLERYDRVYSSKVFDFTPENPYLPEDAIRGGSGYRDIPMDRKLPEEVENCFPDYSIYPECDYAIGYVTRGCIRNCSWCIVPKKEGAIKPYMQWRELVREDSGKLVLMDNNILASDFGVGQLEEIAGQREVKIDCNHGLDARLVTPEIADILARIPWIKYIRFSCDTIHQIPSVKNAVDLLKSRGVKPYRVFIYLLVTDDLRDAAARVEKLRKLGNITIYAQAERNELLGIRPNKEQLEFAQRYIYSGKWRQENWLTYSLRMRDLRRGIVWEGANYE